MKRIVKVTDAVQMNGRLYAILAEDDDERKWKAGSEVITSTLVSIKGDQFETRNTIYEVVNGQVLIPAKQGD